MTAAVLDEKLESALSRSSLTGTFFTEVPDLLGTFQQGIEDARQAHAKTLARLIIEWADTVLPADEDRLRFYDELLAVIARGENPEAVIAEWAKVAQEAAAYRDLDELSDEAHGDLSAASYKSLPAD